MDLKAVAEEHYREVEPDLQAISTWMYENPETGYQEFETSAKLAQFLRNQGFAVEYPAWGLDTAFDAVAGSTGPEVVICAELDALPEVGHACGHNIIATAAAGAGVALLPLVDELGIKVRVLGTPAEETFGGKVDLIEAGAFESADAAMMIHPTPTDMVDPDVLAVAHIDVAFHGKESHAAFAPQISRNALDAAVQAYNNVSMLRQKLYPTDRVHGTITYGGGAPNVIPAFTSMGWYVRAATAERLEELKGQVVACFEGAATATGCTFEVSKRGNTFTDMISDPVMVDLFAANSEALGRPMGRMADSDEGPGGSTDMGNVSHVVPTIHPMLGIDSLPAVNHQKEFAARTVTPAGQKAIRDGALGMAWTVIDLATEDRWAELGSAGK